MASVVLDLIPPRDMKNLIKLHILEGIAAIGPFHEIEIVTQIGVYPEYISQYTTNLAGDETSWFMVFWVDSKGAISETSVPVAGGTTPTEILASLDDIGAQLDNNIIKPTPSNTALLQISIKRMVEGYLSRVITRPTMASWTSPLLTPDIIREIAAKFIAAQLYYNETSRSTSQIPDNHFAQRRYDEAMALLNMVLAGEIVIDDTTVVDDTASLSLLDGFPIDATGRAFTIGMEL